MLKIEKFTDVCLTGGTHYTPIQTSVNFSADISPEMLKLGRVTKFKMLFLMLVFVFNFDLFKFSAAILKKGLFQIKRRKINPSIIRRTWSFHVVV